MYPSLKSSCEQRLRVRRSYASSSRRRMNGVRSETFTSEDGGRGALTVLIQSTKPGRLGVPDQIAVTGRPVAVLQHQQVGDSVQVGVLVVVLVTVQAQHHVRVLLQRAGLPKVGQDRPLVLT